MKKLYRFFWDCGRQGSLEGLFFANERGIKLLFEREIYFCDVLGKHSEIYGTVDEGNIQEIKLSEATLLELYNTLGDTVSGYNPLDYLQEADEYDED